MFASKQNFMIWKGFLTEAGVKYVPQEKVKAINIGSLVYTDSEGKEAFLYNKYMPEGVLELAQPWKVIAIKPTKNAKYTF